jgi:hypothetical protein
MCDMCDDNGWLCAYDSERFIFEIQRCDECKVFKTDDDASEDFSAYMDDLLLFVKDKKQTEEFQQWRIAKKV